MKRLITAVIIATLVLSSCGTGTRSMPGTSALTTSTTVPASTSSTTEVSTTVPEAPRPSFSFPTNRPTVRLATGPCEVPGDSHYCVWGTRPVELTVNNSRQAEFASSASQTFTALSQGMNNVRTEIGVEGAGRLEPAPEGAMPATVCVALVLMTEVGLEIGRSDLVSGGDGTTTEAVDVPLNTGLIPGARYALEVRQMPACAGKTMRVMVAMSSSWKYPRSAGSLTIDGHESIGSLWARID